MKELKEQIAKTFFDYIRHKLGLHLFLNKAVDQHEIADQILSLPISNMMIKKRCDDKCFDGYIFDNSGSGLCNVPCPICITKQATVKDKLDSDLQGNLPDGGRLVCKNNK